MTEELQRYKIQLTYGSDGYWTVNGFWEVPAYDHSPNSKKVWNLDGAPRMFKTRKEALEFCLNQAGIPE